MMASPTIAESNTKYHKHNFKPLKMFRWQGTDYYIVVHGCIDCFHVIAGTVPVNLVPAPKEEIEEAERVASDLLRINDELQGAAN